MHINKTDNILAFWDDEEGKWEVTLDVSQIEEAAKDLSMEYEMLLDGLKAMNVIEFRAWCFRNGIINSRLWR